MIPDSSVLKKSNTNFSVTWLRLPRDSGTLKSQWKPGSSFYAGSISDLIHPLLGSLTWFTFIHRNFYRLDPISTFC